MSDEEGGESSDELIRVRTGKAASGLGSSRFWVLSMVMRDDKQDEEGG
jgi:hypothetical protein